MKFRFTLAFLVAFALAACGGVTSPSNNVTETPSGVIPVQGSGPLHTFNVSNSGEYTITVTSLSPPISAYFIMYFGQMVSGQCSIFSSNYFATVNVAGSTGPIQKGQYCVQLADEGYFTQGPETYTLKISHP